jgi:hypothetical protein
MKRKSGWQQPLFSFGGEWNFLWLVAVRLVFGNNLLSPSRQGRQEEEAS